MGRHEAFMLQNAHCGLGAEVWGVLEQSTLPEGWFVRNQVVCRPQHSGELQPAWRRLDGTWFGDKPCGSKHSVSLLSFVIPSSQIYAAL